MAGAVTKPKNVIPTEVYLRGNEVSRIPVEQTSKYRIATDEDIQSIINVFDPGSGGQGVDYVVATDQDIKDIIDSFPPGGEDSDYSIATDDDIQDIIDEFGGNGNNSNNSSQPPPSPTPEENTSNNNSDDSGTVVIDDFEYNVATDDDIQNIIDGNY